jgi:hypothetical protein
LTMIIVQLSHGLALISSCTDWREAILEKELLSSKFNFFFTKNHVKQLILNAQSIFKFDDSQRKTVKG